MTPPDFGKSISVGEALRGRVSERTEEVLRKYFDGNYSGHITLSRMGFGFRTDCSLHLDSGIHAGGGVPTPTDAYASADQALLMIEKTPASLQEPAEGSLRPQAHAASAALAEIGAPTLDAAELRDRGPSEGDEEVTGYNPSSSRRRPPP